MREVHSMIMHEGKRITIILNKRNIQAPGDLNDRDYSALADSGNRGKEEDNTVIASLSHPWP